MINCTWRHASIETFVPGALSVEIINCTWRHTSIVSIVIVSGAFNIQPSCSAIRKLLHNWLQLSTSTCLVARGDLRKIYLYLDIDCRGKSYQCGNFLSNLCLFQPWSCTLAGSSLFFCVLDVVILGYVISLKNFEPPKKYVHLKNFYLPKTWPRIMISQFPGSPNSYTRPLGSISAFPAPWDCLHPSLTVQKCP